ncbi:MAG: triose-phosphate isomerase [Nitrospinae bacterium]|nr:triose-phosphate isomerase [Nitrospinota bacterium]
MARRLLVAGNWKMNNTVGQSLDLVESLKKETRDIHKVDIIVAPPFTAIKPVYDILENSSIQISGQNVFWEESGAYTGEVSPMMLKEAGCKWVIVGHSERRQYFGETDETVNRRLKAAAPAGLKVIACVGETLEEREKGETMAVLERQVKGAMAGVSHSEIEKVVIAYEPVWAIGTGKTATSDQAEEAHAFIRSVVAGLYDVGVGESTRILYGGSVKAQNAQELFSRANVDGGLVGGASLKAQEFIAIIRAALESSE